MKLRSTSAAEKNFAGEITWITWKTKQDLEIWPFLNSLLEKSGSFDTEICEIAIKGRYIVSSFEISRLLRCSTRVSSFQNLLDFWGRKRTTQFSILLDCSIQEQLYLRPIVFDHVFLRSNLICRRRAPVRCWWRQWHVCWWTQMVNTTTAPHMYSKFIDAWNMQICGGCGEHPSFEWPWILYHLLFGFGSVEIAQKYMCCVQVMNVKTKPHAYAKFNRTSNVQMCIVCSNRPFN